jgi:ComF family protein
VTLRAVADTLLCVLFAPPCAVCAAVLRRPLAGAVCERCWEAVHLQPSGFFLPVITRALAIAPYEGTMRSLIHALKYDGRRSISAPLSALMATHGRDVLCGADVVVPVPLHRRRQRIRGFNQAADLAHGLGLPVADALVRSRVTQPQVDLPAEQRRENVRGAFALKPASLHLSASIRRCREREIDDRSIVLVDDVATTGATLESCARVLMRAGAREVRALTAARAVIALPQTRRG